LRILDAILESLHDVINSLNLTKARSVLVLTKILELIPNLRSLQVTKSIAVLLDNERNGITIAIDFNSQQLLMIARGLAFAPQTPLTRVIDSAQRTDALFNAFFARIHESQSGATLVNDNGWEQPVGSVANQRYCYSLAEVHVLSVESHADLLQLVSARYYITMDCYLSLNAHSIELRNFLESGDSTSNSQNSVITNSLS
jgi:hypothetical protein